MKRYGTALVAAFFILFLVAAFFILSTWGVPDAHAQKGDAFEGAGTQDTVNKTLDAPAQQEISPEYLAQWNISNADYLIDVGKYMEALEAYNTAFEAVDNRQIRQKVLIRKANLLSTFLDAPEEAVKIYDDIIVNYPESAETAAYKKGFLLFNMGRFKEAGTELEGYLKKYPDGKYRFQVEVLIDKVKAGELPPPMPTINTVRVLLHRNVKHVTIKGKGLKVDGNEVAGDSAAFTLRQDGIYMGETPLKNEVTIYTGRPLEVAAGRQHKSVRGEVRLMIKKGQLMVINKLEIESYLRAVVPAESPSSWAPETLKAQTVAARTYAIYQINHRQDWAYDVVDNEGDQVYGGVAKERKSTDQAVKETQGYIISQSAKPILAMYTANSGGYTADSMSVFKLSKTYFVSKEDPESLKGQMANWKKTFPIEKVEAGLKNRGVKAAGLVSLEVEDKDSSGRVMKVKVVTQEGGTLHTTGTAVRRAMGLPEILFDIQKTDDGKFVFNGHGFGHGVGYSQWGSAYMGKGGASFKEILAFYYPNTELVKLW
jgi:stage II sporulation protein D